MPKRNSIKAQREQDFYRFERGTRDALVGVALSDAQIPVLRVQASESYLLLKDGENSKM
jgi:hypothetical protein